MGCLYWLNVWSICYPCFVLVVVLLIALCKESICRTKIPHIHDTSLLNWSCVLLSHSGHCAHVHLGPVCNESLCNHNNFGPLFTKRTDVLPPRSREVSKPLFGFRLFQSPCYLIDTLEVELPWRLWNWQSDTLIILSNLAASRDLVVIRLTAEWIHAHCSCTFIRH